MRKVSVIVTLLGAALTAACSDASGPAAGPQFSRQVTFDEFQQTLIDGAVRVEVELFPLTPTGAPVAEEVEIQEPDDLSEEEELESRAMRFENLDLAGDVCRGTLVLAPDFRVQFDGATTEFAGEDDREFEGEHHGDFGWGDHREFAGEDQLTCAAFVTRIQAALDAGQAPVVEAEREPPAAPQAPDDPTFVAAEFEIEDRDHRSEAPELEINVGLANLLPCDELDPAPDGCIGVLKILNVAIALVEDVTEFESELPGATEEIDFEGVVTAVERMGESCALGSVTLDGEVTVRLVAGTEIKDGDLCRVEQALSTGVVIEAEGEGLVEDADERMIIATEIEFEAED